MCTASKITHHPRRHAYYLQRHNHRKLLKDLAEVDDISRLNCKQLRQHLRAFNISPWGKIKEKLVEALMENWTLSRRYRHEKPFHTTTSGTKKQRRRPGVSTRPLQNKQRTSATQSSRKRRRQNNPPRSKPPCKSRTASTGTNTSARRNTSQRTRRPPTSTPLTPIHRSGAAPAEAHTNIGRIIERRPRAPLMPTTAVVGQRLIHDCEIVGPNMIQRNFGVRSISQSWGDPSAAGVAWDNR